MLQVPSKEWWYPHDFMQEHPSHPLFVGYEASARLSELAKYYPEMIESKKEGKYTVRKLVRNGIYLCYERLPIELKVLLMDYKSKREINLTLF